MFHNTIPKLEMMIPFDFPVAMGQSSGSLVSPK